MSVNVPVSTPSPRTKRSRKAMRLIDPYTGKMQCRHCGSVHYSSIKPLSGGLFYRGSWQCCRPECPSKA